MLLPYWQVVLTLGLLLAIALAVGGAASLVRLPKVTAYLLVGVSLGPSLLNWIPRDHIHLMEPLTKLAIALVLFHLGCHFPMARVRPMLRSIVRLSAGELGLTFLLVTVGLGLLGESWAAAILLGALALATAPATTILVLQEIESEGPVTEYTNSLVALNNLASIVAFELLFVAIYFVQGKLPSPAAVLLGQLALDLSGSLFLGIAAGLVVAFFYGLVEESRRLILLVATIAVLLGVCEYLEVPYLLTFLAMGMTLVNASDHGRQVTAELDRLTGLLCVVFFVTHGAEMDLHTLWKAGLVGVGYIVLRLVGKCVGPMLASRSTQDEPSVRRWLGTTLMSQAGAAIALSAIAAQRDPELGQHLQTIILGTVVVFEFLGPLLIRHAVLRAGEVPLAHAVRHSSTSALDELQTVWNRVLSAMGRDPWGSRPTTDLTVRDIMRRNVKGIPFSATFNEIVRHVEHSHDNTFPVIDDDSAVVGVIRYHELSHAFFDRELGGLVRAADVTTAVPGTLYPDQPVARASEMFSAGKDDCIPVVTPDQPHRLLGVVRRRDVLRLLIRSR